MTIRFVTFDFPLSRPLKLLNRSKRPAKTLGHWAPQRRISVLQCWTVSQPLPQERVQLTPAYLMLLPAYLTLLPAYSFFHIYRAKLYTKMTAKFRGTWIWHPLVHRVSIYQIRKLLPPPAYQARTPPEMALDYIYVWYMCAWNALHMSITVT